MNPKATDTEHKNNQQRDREKRNILGTSRKQLQNEESQGKEKLNFRYVKVNSLGTVGAMRTKTCSLSWNLDHDTHNS